MSRSESSSEAGRWLLHGHSPKRECYNDWFPRGVVTGFNWREVVEQIHICAPMWLDGTLYG